jgi:hypothetical protein
MKTLPDVMTVEQLAAFLGQDKHDLYKAIKAGKISGACRRGKRWFVGTEVFLRAVTGGRKKPRPRMPDGSRV